MAVNLLAALDGERYGAGTLARAHAAAARAGYALRRVNGAGDRLAAWIDLHFAPSSWSSEAGAGSAWVAERDGAIAGFAAFGARGLRFHWLRRWRERADAGIFGPFGLLPAHRKTGIGETLLAAALASLREAGYDAALIPAVSGERLIASYVARTGATVVDEFALITAERKYRTAILASGAGTNARNVLERVRARELPLDVAAVVANHAAAGALTIARDHAVDAIPIVWERERESRDDFDARLTAQIAAIEPELVLLLGWMHLLSPEFLRRFPATINVHPAFLPLDPAADELLAPDGTTIPALRGAHALRDALRAGCRWSGATVHVVSDATDRGEVLVRVPVPVGTAATEAALRDLVRPAEFAAVPAAIRRWVFER